jgi:hypothetical protein
VILGLAILATVTIGLNQLAERFSEDTRNAVAASQLRSVGEAARSFIKDNYASLAALATAGSPAYLDVPYLVAQGRLPPGFASTNAFGQAVCVLVLQPAAYRLQALVVTEGGTALGDPSLGAVAAAVGGSGGGVYASDPAAIRGALGGWSLPVAGFDNRGNHLGRRCDGSAGNVRLAAGRPVMALWFENGDASAPFLARDAVPGRPELNAMNTPLVMNATQTVGAACAATGAIAQDGSGAVLSCQGGTWRLAGDGKCVATTQDLNQLQADGRCYNGVALANSPAGADWVFVEVYRHYNPAIYYLVQRATGMTGASVGKVWSRAQNSATQGGGWSAWAQQADAQVVIGGGSGSVSAAGNIVAGATVQGTHVYSSGNVAAAGNVQGNGVYGNVLRSYGDSQTDGNASALANTINHNGAIYNVGDSWAFQGLGPAGPPTASRRCRADRSTSTTCTSGRSASGPASWPRPGRWWATAVCRDRTGSTSTRRLARPPPRTASMRTPASSINAAGSRPTRATGPSKWAMPRCSCKAPHFVRAGRPSPT